MNMQNGSCKLFQTWVTPRQEGKTSHFEGLRNNCTTVNLMVIFSTWRKLYHSIQRYALIKYHQYTKALFTKGVMVQNK